MMLNLGMKLPQTREIIDDETGASFWPTYPGMIALDGSAAIRFEGVDISPFAGVAGTATPYKIRLLDSGLFLCEGYLAEADAALALGSDVMTGWDFTSGWTAINTTINDNNSFTANAAYGYIIWDTALTSGGLYKLVIVASASVGVWKFQTRNDVGGWNTITSSNGTYYFVGRGGGTADILLQCVSNGATLDLTTLEIFPVTHVGADGCHVVSTKNGSTQNWASKDASFDYNDPSGYTFEITRR